MTVAENPVYVCIQVNGETTDFVVWTLFAFFLLRKRHIVLCGEIRVSFCRLSSPEICH